ncbi:aminotransferase class IV [Cryptosporangium arvum]|uniref:aminotransferase class IV n=1 Tax=Cryptosporangium arvum TaxID=80871 RepID=UPI00055A2D2B|nr:aminotransferase class IV [Cryptosporangium arvum]
MTTRALALLGRGPVPVETPIARADDAGLTRGDGIFETVHVRYGKPWQLDEHLARMAGSARTLGIALPPAGELAALIDDVLVDAVEDAEVAVKIVCTRGPDTGQAEPPTVFATMFDVSPAQLRGRREGVSVVSISLGVPADARNTAPWLLGGAKTLSYAVNMAALRHAASVGADDAILVSTEGEVLEAPTATVVWAADGALRTVPVDTGILAGTTASFLLERAGELGLRAEHARVRVDELAAADEVWLCSSVRGAARVTTLDGKPLGERGFTEGVQRILGFPL